MLSRSQRLSLAKFNIVMEKGRVHHSSLFLIRAMQNQTDTRIAAVAPKKVAKTAVGRNYMRRKIYEATRDFFSSIVPGVHIIIFAKPAAMALKPKDLASDLRTLFVKAGLLG